MNAKPPTVLTNLQRGNVKQESPILLHQRTIHELAAQGELYDIDTNSIEQVDFNRMTPLLWAAGYGQTMTVEFLLRLGANPNHKASDGKTALMLASNGGFVHVVRTLVRRGANLDETDETGSTSLMYAAYHDNSLIVEELLKNNADLGILNRMGQTAYSIALLRQNQHAQATIEAHLLTSLAGGQTRTRV